jgi:serine/threonine-protein kinase
MADPQLGRYQIAAEIGRGAMGVVYKAHDPVLGRTVAVKTVNMALERDEAAQYEARFLQEARAAGGLNHPNLVTIYDIGKSGEVAYMAMEFIEGVELRTLLTPGKPLPLEQAVSITAQVAEGLAYAHSHGVVHRDVKPANIMVTASGGVKITDFGIARMRSAAVQTQTGAALGSPKYMSPEQVLGKRADHRSDLFSLGVIAYEMLAGAAPFSGENINALMYQIVHFAPPAPSTLNPAVAEMLDCVVAKMLAKSLEERYQDGAELARDLRECERRGAGAHAPRPPAAALSPGAQPSTIGDEASTMVLAQTVVHTRRADDAAEETVPSPAHGLARSFDSAEATQRLAALTAVRPAAGAEASTTQLLRQLQVPPRRAWGWRDVSVIAVAALLGLLAAAAILRG